MRRTVKRVWFLAAPGTGLLNIGGPWEVLGHANDVLGRTGYELTLLGPSAPAVPTGHGLVVSMMRALPQRPRRLPDVVIVAGFWVLQAAQKRFPALSRIQDADAAFDLENPDVVVVLRRRADASHIRVPAFGEIRLQ